MKTIRFLCTTLLALPLVSGSFDDKSPPRPIAVAEDPAPVVQVRDYWQSPVVTVVAFDQDDDAFGLRTSITRTGKLVGGLRAGDHRLYMTPYLVRDMGGFAHASVTQKEELLSSGYQRDDYACFYGAACSPMVTVGIRVPDTLLRAHRDGMTVIFFPRVQEPWTLSLRPQLIDAYLAKVDSVVRAMKKSGTS